MNCDHVARGRASNGAPVAKRFVWKSAWNVSLNGCQRRYGPEVPFDGIIWDNERKTVQIYVCLHDALLNVVERDMLLWVHCWIVCILHIYFLVPFWIILFVLLIDLRSPRPFQSFYRDKLQLMNVYVILIYY